MRWIALACDYDGTIAHHGTVAQETLDALARVKESGRKLLLVTGRELDDLQRVFPHLALFDRVVAENGALLYRPASQEEVPLCDPPPPAFAAELRARGIEDLSEGRVIVATWEPHQSTVLDVVHRQGLELHVIFNKGAVMVLPSGVNKAFGLKKALDELQITAHDVIAVGDAENDHAFVTSCGAGVAVANALPSLKNEADVVLDERNGDGVRALVEMLLAGSLDAPKRHTVLVGASTGGAEVRLPVYGQSMLIAGPSESGKSTLTTALVERVVDAGYQIVVIDPEGDYGALEGVVHLGDPEHPPTVAEVVGVLENASRSAVVNLLAIPLDDRPAFLRTALPAFQELRARSAHPHWIVVDEAHHMLRHPPGPSRDALPASLDGVLMITVHPDWLPADIVTRLSTVMLTGEGARETLERLCAQMQAEPPAMRERPDETVLVWTKPAREAHWVSVEPGRTERRRHVRKYAEGELAEDRSFYFRGPEEKLNLRAQNLQVFLRIGEGVDEETWTYHRDRHDYSAWITEFIKDPELGERVRDLVEDDRSLAVGEARARLRKIVEEAYTAPA